MGEKCQDFILISNKQAESGPADEKEGRDDGFMQEKREVKCNNMGVEHTTRRR